MGVLIMKSLQEKRRNKMIYALYKGDNFIDMGTADELANKLDVRSKTIKYLASPANLRRIENRNNSKNAMITVRVGFENEVI